MAGWFGVASEIVGAVAVLGVALGFAEAGAVKVMVRRGSSCVVELDGSVSSPVSGWSEWRVVLGREPPCTTAGPDEDTLYDRARKYHVV